MLLVSDELGWELLNDELPADDNFVELESELDEGGERDCEIELEEDWGKEEVVEDDLKIDDLLSEEIVE